MTELVYVLLPVHNRKDITAKFVDSLLKQSFRDYHLLLIDDGSIDGTEEMVRELVSADKLTVIKGKGNWWWAGSLQQGINWLNKYDVKSSDIVLMINDDVTFKPDFLENGVEFIQQHPNSLLLSRFYDAEKDEIVETGVKADLRHMSFVDADTPEEINCLSTRGLFLTWDVLKRMGNFHPVILPHYGSDYEFTMRAARKGFDMVTVKDVVLIPDHSATGVREYEADSFTDEIKVMFSKRCTYNPVYWTSLILLAFPIRYMASNIFRVWAGAVWRLLKSFRKELAIWKI